jgi:hypothetical protein
MTSAPVQAQVSQPKIETTQRQVVLLSPYMEFAVTATSSTIPAIGSQLRPNQQVATFMIVPKTTATTTTASPRRPGAFPESLPAGTPMFQINVDNGVAYCAFWGPTQGLRETQCFRDLNNDGTFDAGYLTYDPLVGKSLFIGRIARLAGMPPVAYATQPNASVAPEPFSYRFVRVRDGIAEFKPQFGLDRRGFRITKCNLRVNEPCSLGMHDFVFQETAGGLTVTSVTPVDRQLVLYAERDE